MHEAEQMNTCAFESRYIRSQDGAISKWHCFYMTYTTVVFEQWIYVKRSKIARTKFGNSIL